MWGIRTFIIFALLFIIGCSATETFRDKYPTEESVINHLTSPDWVNEECRTNRRWELACPSGNTYYIRYRFTGIRTELEDIMLGFLFYSDKIKDYEDYKYVSSIIRHMKIEHLNRALEKKLNLLEINCIDLAYADREFFNERHKKELEEMDKRTVTQKETDENYVILTRERINRIVYKNETPPDMYKYLEWLEE
jgi:hypothetical protein